LQWVVQEAVVLATATLVLERPQHLDRVDRLRLGLVRLKLGKIKAICTKTVVVVAPAVRVAQQALERMDSAVKGMLTHRLVQWG
jgi:hypothetical protein